MPIEIDIIGQDNNRIVPAPGVTDSVVTPAAATPAGPKKTLKHPFDKKLLNWKVFAKDLADIVASTGGTGESKKTVQKELDETVFYISPGFAGKWNTAVSRKVQKFSDAMDKARQLSASQGMSDEVKKLIREAHSHLRVLETQFGGTPERLVLVGEAPPAKEPTEIEGVGEIGEAQGYEGYGDMGDIADTGRKGYAAFGSGGNAVGVNRDPRNPVYSVGSGGGSIDYGTRIGSVPVQRIVSGPNREGRNEPQRPNLSPKMYGVQGNRGRMLPSMVEDTVLGELGYHDPVLDVGNIGIGNNDGDLYQSEPKGVRFEIIQGQDFLKLPKDGSILGADNVGPISGFGIKLPKPKIKLPDQLKEAQKLTKDATSNFSAAIKTSVKDPIKAGNLAVKGITKVGTAVAKVDEAVVKAVIKADIAILKAPITVVQKAAPAVASQVKKVNASVKSAGKNITNAANSSMKQLEKAKDKVGEVAQQAAKSGNKAVLAAANATKKQIESAGKKVEGGFKQAGKGLENIKDTVGHNAQNVVRDAGKAAEDIKDKVGGVAGDIGEGLKKLNPLAFLGQAGKIAMFAGIGIVAIVGLGIAYKVSRKKAVQ